MADDDKKDLLGGTAAAKPAAIDQKAFAAQTAPSVDADAERRRKEFDAWQKKQDDEAQAARDKASADEQKAKSDREAADAKAKEDAKKAPEDPKAKAKDKPAKPPYEGEDVTYTPGKDDPETTKWRGVEFKAGQPVRIKDMHHIDAIRGNKFFRVGDGKSVSELDKEPENATEYRAHVWRWMNGPGMTTIDAICRKWSSESELRRKCEVGQDDVKMLGTLIEPKMKQLRMAEGLSDLQVAQLWVAHGTLDLPWRAS